MRDFWPFSNIVQRNEKGELSRLKNFEIRTRALEINNYIVSKRQEPFDVPYSHVELLSDQDLLTKEPFFTFYIELRFKEALNY